MDPIEYEKFTKNGFWTARRRGLFRRGVTESVAYQWIREFIFTKDIIEGLEKFTNCSFDKNYQHKDSSDSRIALDSKCLKLIENFFEEYDPFSETVETLINIANGISATEKSNCHNAFEEGIKIMKDISGTKIMDLKLSRSKVVKTIASSNSIITIEKNAVEIDPDVLFHRICVIKKSNEDMREYLEWELSPFPQAYFNSFGMLKKTTPEFYSLFKKVSINIRDSVWTHYVIDGDIILAIW
ncbi:hypothetical protein TKK_0006809 [Trichogramma kaykai]